MDLKTAIYKRLDGRSEAWLARKSGLAPSQLNRLIRNKLRWNLDHLIAVSTALNVSVWKLLKEAEKGE